MLAWEIGKFKAQLKKDIAQWQELLDLSQEPAWPVVVKLPEYLDALAAFSQDARLAKEDRRIANRVVKYIISPLDLMPEFVYGPKGYCEDCYLLFLSLRHWEKKFGAAALQSYGLNSRDFPPDRFVQAGEKLDPGVREHLQQLLEAEAFAGDDEEDDPQLLPSKTLPSTIVFAGPGTGKTCRLEEELVRLLGKGKVKPENILVTTFTNKAADELRIKTREKLRAESLPDQDQILPMLYIGTIHSFCYQLIARFQHHLLFLKGTFAPINETERLLFLFRHGVGELGLQGLYKEWKELQEETNTHKSGLFHFYEDVGQIYDFLSEEVIGGTDKVLKGQYLKICYGQASQVREKIIRTYPGYWELLQREGFLDFAMAMAYVEALLEDPHVLYHVRAQYRHILVDEYQDTNPIQDRIFRKIAGETGRVFAVADDDQSIYAFRGADFHNALDFEKRYRGTKEPPLAKHYRSTKKLLKASQSLIGHNRQRQEKNLHTERPEGCPPWLVKAQAEQLPQRLAKVLLDLKSTGWIKNWFDVALLTRGMGGRIKDYVEAFKESGVPVALVSDRHFFKKPAINALVGALKLIAGDWDEITTRKYRHKAFFEAVGITEKEAMLALLRKWNLELHAAAKAKHDSLLDLFYAILTETQAVKIESLLPELGWFSNILADAEEQVRSQDLVKRLGYFLDFVEAADGGLAGPEPEIENAAQLMTIHKAKGLEFPVVVILEATAGAMPAHFQADPRIDLRCLLGGARECPDIMEEERRVLYVGMTRAQDLLLIATTVENPSPFLREFEHEPLPEKLIKNKPAGFSYVSKRSLPLLHAPHSHLYNYHFCPKRYWLENRCQFAGRAIAPLRAGLSLHRALEILHRLLRDRERITSARKKMIFERAWIAPGRSKQNEKEYQELYRIFDNYAATWEDQKAKAVRELEYPFYVAGKQGVLTGKIDLVQENRGQLEIVEFKFHKNPLMADYPHEQLEHYSLALSREKPKLVVHYLKEGKSETIKARPAREIKEELAETFEKIRNKKFEAKPDGQNCKICPVKFACSDAETRRKKK